MGIGCDFTPKASLRDNSSVAFKTSSAGHCASAAFSAVNCEGEKLREQMNGGFWGELFCLPVFQKGRGCIMRWEFDSGFCWFNAVDAGKSRSTQRALGGGDKENG